MVEQTFIFLKPDAVKRGLVGDILKRFEQRGFKIKLLKMITLSDEMTDKHYEEHVSKTFYPGLKYYVTSGPVVAAILEANSAVSIVRDMVGATDASKATPGTIRGDYGLEVTQNIIHASDSVANAKREIANFFPDYNIEEEASK